MNKQKEKLIELLDQVTLTYRLNAWENTDKIADYLIANGVIVPPCKVGDKVYKIMTAFGYVNECKVVGFHLGKFPTLRGHKRKQYFVCYADYHLYHIPFDDIGKTVFLTREEAEKALEERKEK